MAKRSCTTAAVAAAIFIILNSSFARSEIDPTAVQQANAVREVELDQMCSSDDPVSCSPISLRQTAKEGSEPDLVQQQAAAGSKMRAVKDGITEDKILSDIQYEREQAFRSYAATLAAYTQVFASGNTVEIPAGLDPSIVSLVGEPANAQIVAYDFMVKALRRFLPPPYLSQIQAYVGF